jgi:hypothetical protein
LARCFPPALHPRAAGSTHSSLSARLAQYRPAAVDLEKGADRLLMLREVVPWRKQFNTLLG